MLIVISVFITILWVTVDSTFSNSTFSNVNSTFSNADSAFSNADSNFGLYYYLADRAEHAL